MINIGILAVMTNQELRNKEIEARVLQRLYFKAYRERNKERLKEYERMRYLRNKERKANENRN